MNEDVQTIAFAGDAEFDEGVSIAEVEARLEQAIWCCDYDPDQPDRASCGYSF